MEKVSELVKCVIIKTIYEDLEKQYATLWRYKPTIRECNVISTIKMVIELMVLWRFFVGFDAHKKEYIALIYDM